jgi:hypothetical protein
LERDRLREREEEEGASECESVMLMLGLSGRGGGRPTLREGDEGWRESGRYLLGESAAIQAIAGVAGIWSWSM